jgi:hypothetical protein
MPRRRDLRPARPVSDEAFLRAAAASATRAANEQERRRRREATERENAEHERRVLGGRPSATERGAVD